MSKKIKDNESIQPLINLLQLGELSFFVLDKIPFIYKLSPKIKSFKEQFIEIQKALLHKDLKCKAPLIEPNLRRNLGKWST